MAADEHGLALAGEVHEHISHPPNSFRVESVCGLIENHCVRIAKQNRCEPEALAHAEREAADAPLGDFGEADQLEHFVDSCGPDAV